MQVPRAVLFDVDDTLAESFKPPAPEMVERLIALLSHVPVALVSAAGFPRIERDFLGTISASPDAGRFYVLSNSTTECFAYREDQWKLLYRISFKKEGRAEIVRAMEGIATETGIALDPAHPPRIIEQESKVAYAALGLDASAEEKAAWDPDTSKRILLQNALKQHFPDFEVRIGGKTTVDVLPHGMNKAYGVAWLSKELGIPCPEMLFIGDAFYPGGNDEVVVPTGIQTRETSGPDETLRFIDDLLSHLN